MNNMDTPFVEENNDIAVIGLSCRFPGAQNYNEYWANLIAGRETIRRFSDEELRNAGIPEDMLSHPDYVKAQGVLDDIAGFDAPFFGISPGEAEIIDPQHRLFLEQSWAALEDAGYNPDTFDGRIGVYGGAGLNSYLLRAMMENPQAVMDKGPYLVLMSSDKDYMATRVSYKLNLNGTSLNVATACSTSLVALDLACQSLLSYQNDMVLAGGVTLQVPHHSGYLYEEGATQSKDGHCRAFDAEASGLVGGNGVGLVVLKRLEDALADKDRILAVIKGSATNNDGSHKAGYSAPSVDGQAQVIAEAQANAGVHPDTISYIEAHGTGTRLGDPIEVKALTKAFRTRTDARGFCKIGSVKTNMGHLDSAAGIAGLIKTVLSLHHGQIPPSLHFKHPNPEIDFDNSPFVVNTTLCDWPRGNTPRRAGISSFGIGGTNAHVIVEEAPKTTPPVRKDHTGKVILPLSAKSPNALQQACDNLANHLRDNPDLDLRDVAYTLTHGRQTFPYRKAVTCTDMADAIKQLHHAAQTPQPGIRTQKTVFMFPGQGTQYVDMGKGLYQAFDLYREIIDQCANILLDEIKWDIRDTLCATRTVDLKRTDIAQPLLFSVEYALAELLKSFGITPDLMIGHSLGEYVCATQAGVFDLEDALRLVARRGALMQNMAPGAMLGVPLSKDTLCTRLPDGLSLAAHNAPARCVVAGPQQAIEQFQQDLADEGMDSTLLHTSHAFHSADMNPMLADFTRELEAVERHVPTLPFAANLTGGLISDDEARSVQYWVNHLRQCVRFGDGLQRLNEEGNCLFIEVGPGNVLSTFTRLGLHQKAYSILRHAKDSITDLDYFKDMLATLWENGQTVDFLSLQDPQAQRVALPTYPFQHKPYWISATSQRPAAISSDHKRDAKDWLYVPSWKRAAPLSQHTNASISAPVLMFMDERGIGQSLCDHAPTKDIIQIFAGTRYRKVDASTYHLNPTQPDDYKALLDDLRQQQVDIQTIVHGWALGGDETSLERLLDKGFYSLISLVQALDHHPARYNLHILSNNLNDVTGTEALRPTQATLLGPLRVIALEHPDILCKAIDLSLDDNIARLPQDLTSRIWTEITHPDCAHQNTQMIALRGTHRWVQHFEPISPPEDISNHPAHLRENGVYMIAGGLNGIGLELAYELARTQHAKLALTGTAELPAREDWASYLHNHTTEDTQLVNLSGSDPQALENTIHQDLAIKGIETYDTFADKVNHLCCLYICRLFARHDKAPDMSPGQQTTRTDLLDTFAIQDKFIKLFDYILKVLDQDGVIKRQGDDITFLQDPSQQDDPVSLQDELEEAFPDFKPIFDVFDHCMHDYARALSGEIEAVGVLFPGGGESIWDKATKAIPEHTHHRVYTQMARELVLEKIAKSPNRTVKILELGAGAGVMTDVIAPTLRGKNVEYTFTDISKSFVLKAERKAREQGLDFMKFGLLDISQDPQEQGFDPASFDIILELDCVHATPLMRDTMAQVKKLLAPDGVVLFVESVVTQRWMNLPLGLLEGWWYFQDEDLRCDSPLLSLDKWQDLFDECGLRVATYPQDGDKRTNADSGLIIGEMPNCTPSCDPIARKIQHVQELERLGAQVLPLRADISDKTAMAQAIERTESTFGPLNGFIQTAAVENRGPILTKTKDLARSEFLPKIQGTQIVDQLLGQKGLDFILLSSSHSAYDVGAGDVEYCSSNAFVDYFAALKSRENTTPVIAVNWDRWRAVGMAQAYETMMEKRLGQRLQGGMSVQQGCDAFRHVLNLSPLPAQVVVSTCDFNARLNEQAALLESEASDTKPDGDMRSDLLGPYEAPQNDLETQMVAIWQEVLGIGQIGISDNFYDLGGDSLIAIKVLSRLRERFDTELSVNDLFDCPTVHTLCTRLEATRWAHTDIPANHANMEEGVI